MVILLVACTWLTKADLESALDPDGDGSPEPADCAPEQAAVHPGAVERCNGLDDDCDGQTDPEGAEGCALAFVDLDEDGAAGTERCLCEVEGLATVAEDCDDADPQVRPGAVESCNGLDDDCDGQTDPDGSEGCLELYMDSDGDGYAGTPLCSCEEGLPAEPSDCDDADEDLHPEAEELCGDGVEQACGSLACPPEGLACLERGPLDLSGATSAALGDEETAGVGATLRPVDALLPGGLAVGEWGGDQLWLLSGPPSGEEAIGAAAALELSAPEGRSWLGEDLLALGPEGDSDGALVISATGNYTEPGAVWLLPLEDLEAPNALENQGRELWSGEVGLIGASLAEADLDGDGLTELLVGEVGPNRVLVFARADWEAVGAGERLEIDLAEVLSCGGCPDYAAFGRALAVADYSGAGLPELLILSQDRALVVAPGLESLIVDEVARLEIRGSVVSTSSPPDWSLLPPADLDGDGAPDAAFSTYGSEAVSLLSGQSLRYNGVVDLAEDSDARVSGVEVLTSMSSADIDGDCLPELLLGHTRWQGSGWVPTLDALRVDFSAAALDLGDSLLRVEAEADPANRRLTGAPLPAPEGGLSWLAVGAESWGEAHSAGYPGGLFLYDLHQP